MLLLTKSIHAINLLILINVLRINCYEDFKCDTVMPENTGRSIHVIREGIDPVTPYYIDYGSKSPGNKNKTFLEVVEYLETYSCVRMPQVTKDYPGRKLRVALDNDDCVAIWGSGITIGIGGCITRRASIAHEIAHIYGHGHEQDRMDANETFKFIADDTRSFIDVQGIPYDLFSIMQYPATFKYDGLNWMTRDPRMTFMVGIIEKNVGVQQNSFMTYNDLRRFNYQLKCNATCGNIKTTWCENQGYLAPAKTPGETCKCNCPYGTSGERCENGSPIFYGTPCGGTFENDTEIITPGYGTSNYDYLHCSYIVKAKPGKRIELLWEDFNIGYMNRIGGCSSGFVEIRTVDKWKGMYYCTGLVPKNSKMITSDGEDLAIMIEPQWKKYGRGFKGYARYIDPPTPIGCGNGNVIDISENSDPVVIKFEAQDAKKCKWVFKTNWNTAKLAVRFTKLDIKQTSSNQNQIRVYPKPESDKNFFFRSFNNEMKYVYSYGSELIVESDLDSYSTFTAEVIGIRTTDKLFFPSGFTRCNESLVHISKRNGGYFVSPNYYGIPYRGDPSQYPPNVGCTWSYKTTDPSVTSMKIVFEQMKNWFNYDLVELEIDCASDELFIEGADGIRQQICAKKEYVVNGNELKLTFKSGAATQKIGFIGKVIAV